MMPLCAVGGFMLAGRSTALAVVYGVLVALAASMLLVVRERTTRQHPEWDGRKLISVFMLAALERLLAVGLMLGIGFGVLRLSPLPVLLGLALAQLAWLAVVFERRKYPGGF
jgi:ATP synthase protein I